MLPICKRILFPVEKLAYRTFKKNLILSFWITCYFYIILSGQNDIEVAVECLKKGAVDYVVKDMVMNVNLQKIFDKIIKSIELKSEIQSLSQVIKRDKLLMRGYLTIILLMAIGLAFLLLT